MRTIAEEEGGKVVQKSSKVVNAVTISKLIEAHVSGDEEKFKSYANFIADSYEGNGNSRGANIIRNRLNGVKGDDIVTLD